MTLCVPAVALSMLFGATGATGAGSGPQFSPSTWYMVWDNVSVGQSATETLTVTNRGGADETFQGLRIVGPALKDFRVASDGCTGHSVQPGSACKVGITFKPTQDGTRAASLEFVDNTSCANWIQLAGGGQTNAAGTRARAASCSGGGTSTTTTTTTTGSPTSEAPANSSAGATPTSTKTSTSTSTSKSKSAALKLPRSLTCKSRRRFTVRIKAPKGQRITQVSARLNGRHVRVFKGKGGSTVNLRGLPRGRFTLVVRAKTSGGRTISQTRHYVTCVAKKSG